MKIVVLVHGFCRRGGDMRYLAGQMERRGYTTFVPTLPTTFKSVRECGEILSGLLDKEFLCTCACTRADVVHFVGHSMGGLIIRDCLSRRTVENLGRVVLIGTPNGGSPYANLLLRLPFSRRVFGVFGGLPDLAEPGPDIAPPLNVPAPEVGVVIGTKPDFVRKFLLRGAHDGLVTTRSVRSVAAIDELEVPCIHEHIHWRPDTAEAVALFLETGKFSA